MSRAIPCPKCGHDKCLTIGSRIRGDKRIETAVPAYRRRRQCEACGERFSTIEVTEDYLLKLEEWRQSGVLDALLKARATLGISIELLSKVKIKGDLL